MLLLYVQYKDVPFPPGISDDLLFLLEGFKCAAQYPMDEEWYRAEVIERVGVTRFRVRFIDYGNEDVVLASKIRSYGAAQSFLIETPSVAVCCQLTGVDPRQVAGDTFRVTVEGREFVTRIGKNSFC